MFSDAAIYNAKIDAFKNLVKSTPVSMIYTLLPAYLRSMPLTPYPRISKCMGLDPYNGKIEILDRYLRFGFDFKVKSADEKCFFSAFESDKDLVKRLEEEVKKHIGGISNMFH